MNTFLKKSLILCIISILLLPQFAVAEEPWFGLLYNGGFEAVTDGKPDGWGGTQRDWGENSSVAVTTEKVHSGNNAVKIINGDDINPWISRQTSGLIPGATYKVSFWLNAELGKKEEKGVGAKLEFYPRGTASSGIIGSKSILYYGSTNGNWKYVESEFVLPQNATMVKIYMRLYADGYAYVDDVYLELVEIEKFRFESSHVFHYTDEETGNLKVFLHEFYHDSSLVTTSRANFFIFDGESKVAESLDVPFTDGTALFTYSVPKVLKKKGNTYRIYIEAFESDGAPPKTFTQNLYKYDRPKFLDKNGLYHDENGKIVDPVIAYHLNISDYGKAKEAGFNMFQIGYGSAPVKNAELRNLVLNSAEEHGLKGLFSLYLGMNAAGHPDNIENTKQIVEMYKDDPRIFGWIVQDEPLGSGITDEKKKWLEISYKTIREIDPNHPIILTDYSSDVFHETVKYCDVFLPNAYSASYFRVRKYVEEAVKYAQGRPVYPNIGIHARGTGTEAELRTSDEIQHYMYQAFLGGGRGISMYAFSDAVQKPADKPIYQTALWPTLCDAINNEFPILFDLFVHNNESPEMKMTSSYVQRKWSRQDGTYYCLMSIVDYGQSFSFPVEEGKCVSLLGGDDTSSFSLVNDTLTVLLKSGDVVLFMIHDDAGIAITKNGVGVKTTESGTLYVHINGNAQMMIVGLYENIGKEKKLVKFHVLTDETMQFTISEEEKKYSLKAFAWDDIMHPMFESDFIKGCFT